MATRTAEGFKNSVRLMFKNGCSIKEIARAKEKTIVEIEELVIELNLIRLIKPRSSEILGSKTEPYYESEEEMLNPPVYKYEDLTTKEKKFYESRNDK